MQPFVSKDEYEELTLQKQLTSIKKGPGEKGKEKGKSAPIKISKTYAFLTVRNGFSCLAPFFQEFWDKRKKLCNRKAMRLTSKVIEA